MSAPNTSRVYRVTGRLYVGVDPSDLEDKATDYGGTPLGQINRIAFRTGVEHARVYFEQFARTGEVLMMQRDLEVGFSLRDWDGETLEQLWPNTAAGATSPDRVMQFPGTSYESGEKLSAFAKTVLFASDRPEHPSFILYNALPLVDPAEQIDFTFQREAKHKLFFLALPDTNVGPWRCAAMGKLADLEGL